MKTLAFVFLVLTGISYQIHAENYKSSKDDIEKRVQSVKELSRSATLAAKKAGVSEVGSISCDSGFIHCSCKGAFNCAWLAWGCGKAGGIQGFDGDCFFPKSVPGANTTVNKFVSRTGAEEASCDGIFCSCSGPAGSDDCKKIKGCIDDVSCIGDSCGCIGGSVE